MDMDMLDMLKLITVTKVTFRFTQTPYQPILVTYKDRSSYKDRNMMRD